MIPSPNQNRLNEDLTGTLKKYLKILRVISRRYNTDEVIETLIERDIRVLDFVHTRELDSIPTVMKDITDEFSISASTSTRTIDTLVKKGYLKRAISEVDRREIHLILTPRSLELLKKREERIFEFFTRMFKDLDKKDMEDLRRIINKIHVDE